eukprot:m.314538 g.314538  ORF g.314538 m.314538 type:complete len:52 (+) comp27504_c0_seq1:906-1061(+)
MCPKRGHLDSHIAAPLALVSADLTVVMKASNSVVRANTQSGLNRVGRSFGR